MTSPHTHASDDFAPAERGEIRIDLSALADNVDMLASVFGPTQVLAVVKANAYGHGAIECARAALAAGACGLGVATVTEATELRRAGVDGRILLLSEPAPSHIDQMLAADVETVAYSTARLDDFATAASSTGRRIRLHAHIDTGMHRVGMEPSALAGWLSRARQLDLDVVGVMTHFAVADEPDNPFTAQQYERFRTALDGARETFPDWRPTIHTGNSAARLRHAALIAADDMVRCGIAVYGIEPAPGISGAAGRLLRPVMSIHTKVSWTSDRLAGDGISYGQRYRMPSDGRIATLPVGYGDGLPREVCREGHVLIRGRRFPYAGSITMDQCMVDVGTEDVEIGEPVVLLGAQGDETISATDWARWLGTISYEPVTRMGSRLARRFL
jgi:alanine racemase